MASHSFSNPIRCWSCNKAFGDLLHGNIQILPSTNLNKDDFERLPSLIEIMCGRCKAYNSIIDLSFATTEDLLIFNEMANKENDFSKYKQSKNKCDILYIDTPIFKFYDRIMRRIGSIDISKINK